MSESAKHGSNVTEKLVLIKKTSIMHKNPIDANNNDVQTECTLSKGMNKHDG